MCISNSACEVRHPAAMTCGQAASLWRQGWALVPVKELKTRKPVSEKRREYLRQYMREYRARKKADPTPR